MGWPDDKLTINALNSTFKLKQGNIERVSLLGYDGTLEWEHNELGLIMVLPKQRTSDYAIVLKIGLAY